MANKIYLSQLTDDQINYIMQLLKLPDQESLIHDQQTKRRKMVEGFFLRRQTFSNFLKITRYLESQKFDVDNLSFS